MALPLDDLYRFPIYLLTAGPMYDWLTIQFILGRLLDWTITLGALWIIVRMAVKSAKSQPSDGSAQE